MEDTRQALAHRQQELKKYQIYAPCKGVIDRVLINQGEYNQDSGKPGFLIAHGLWFDAYFDQSDFAFIKPKQKVKILLESYSGREIDAEVQRIIPIVSFHSGGPEISRPLRPRGSGSPEWAATFKVVLKIGATDLRVVPGMTGFARLDLSKQPLVIDRESLTSISAGKALVYALNDDDVTEEKEVQIGIIDGMQVEVVAGLREGERVVKTGHWGLRSEDTVEILNKRK